MIPTRAAPRRPPSADDTPSGRKKMALARQTMTDERRKSVAIEATSTGGSILDLFAGHAQIYAGKDTARYPWLEGRK